MCVRGGAGGCRPGEEEGIGCATGSSGGGRNAGQAHDEPKKHDARDVEGERTHPRSLAGSTGEDAASVHIRHG